MNSNLPLDLYKANTELQLHIARLLQENARAWFNATLQTDSEGLPEAQAKIRKLLQTAEWQVATSNPGKVFRRIFDEQLGTAQMLQQLAVKNQMSFAAGLQQALTDWQRAVLAAVGGSGHNEPG